MNRKLAVQINYMVGSMLLEFTKRLGPIPEFDPSILSDTYEEMQKIRHQISETLLDYIDAEEEESMKECTCKKIT